MKNIKKIFFLLLAILTFSAVYAATDNANEQIIRCIYINGANNNTPAMENWFFGGINKLHPHIKKEFEQSAFIKKYLLKDGKLQISQKPDTFFWGNKTLEDLNTVNEGLIETSVFAHCMHDAIWVQKPRNMELIINDLHKQVKAAAAAGDKVILFGYSAGSFITYKYLFYKLTGITSESLKEKMDLTPAQSDIVSSFTVNPTCIDAITASKLAVYSANDELIPNSNTEIFKKAYFNLDKTTKEVCVPNNTIAGIINYASPLVLFYSDIKDPTVEINKYNKELFVSMKNNDIFWITVNFADDPLGYPLTKNLTDDEIASVHNITFSKDGRGFFHDKSDVKSPATFLGAHTSYWKYAKKFSKAVADAFKEGYENFYYENLLEEKL